MRKIVLSMLVVGALVATSCKGEKKEVKEVTTEIKTEVETKVDSLKTETEATIDSLKTEAKEVKEEVEATLEGVTIPDFSNAAVTENLKSYAAYAKEYIDANGDLGKISAIAAKGSELLAKGKELVAGLGADEQAKYSKVLSAIQSKMAPAK